MVALNRAIAVAMVHGPAAGLELAGRARRGPAHWRATTASTPCAATCSSGPAIRAAAIAHYRRAAERTTSMPERTTCCSRRRGSATTRGPDHDRARAGGSAVHVDDHQAAIARRQSHRRRRGPRLGRRLRREHRRQRRAPGDRARVRPRDDGPPVDCQRLPDHAERAPPPRWGPWRRVGTAARVPGRPGRVLGRFAPLCGRTGLHAAHRRAAPAGCCRRAARAHQPRLPRHVAGGRGSQRRGRTVGGMVGGVDRRRAAGRRAPRRRGLLAMGIRRGGPTPAGRAGRHADQSDLHDRKGPDARWTFSVRC